MDSISLIEQNVNRMTDKLFGDKDPALKLITKLNLMYDGTDEYKNTVEETLVKMKRNNEYEVECLLKEMTMTLDNSGNLIPIDDVEISND